MPNKHSSTVFDNELTEFNKTLAEMFGLAKQRFRQVSEALKNGDASKAQELMNGDEAIDVLEKRIDELTIRLLALRDPKASDLRMVVAGQRIATDLERVSDYCSGIAKGLPVLSSPEAEEPRMLLSTMMDTAGEILDLVAESYAEQRVRKAMQAWHLDDKLDDQYAEVIRRLHTPLRNDGSCEFDGLGCTLLLAARAVERIGDHATNIAEHVYFLILGEYFPGR